jgi:uncharacterized protein YaaN involved in tellurite resistance
MTRKINMADTEKEVELDGLDQFQQDFALDVPKEVSPVSPKKLAEKLDTPTEKGDTQTISLKKEVIKSLDDQVDSIVKDLLTAPPESQELKDITSALNRMGDAEITKTTNLSSQLLSRPLRGMRANSYGEGDSVVKNLKNLREKVVELDPKSRDALFSKNKFFGFKIPFSKKVDSYFQEYKSSETMLYDIVKALNNGKDELIENNAYIEDERETMRQMMVRLEQYAYIIKKLDKRIEDRLPEIEAEDKMKAEDIRQEILFPIRQKRMDILQHMAVSMQGYMALQVIKQNNQELIRGVDRATKTTMFALRTAVIVSEALGTQKLVLDQVNAVNDVTNRMIEGNSEMLAKQGVEIQRQAAESAVNVETLEKAFQNIFKAMDAIDTYRSQALPNMEKTINSLEKTVENAKEYMSSRRQERIGNLAGELLSGNDSEENKKVVKIR